VSGLRAGPQHGPPDILKVEVPYLKTRKEMLPDSIIPGGKSDHLNYGCVARSRSSVRVPGLAITVVCDYTNL